MIARRLCGAALWLPAAVYRRNAAWHARGDLARHESCTCARVLRVAVVADCQTRPDSRWSPPPQRLRGASELPDVGIHAVARFLGSSHGSVSWHPSLHAQRVRVHRLASGGWSSAFGSSAGTVSVMVISSEIVHSPRVRDPCALSEFAGSTVPCQIALSNGSGETEAACMRPKSSRG